MRRPTPGCMHLIPKTEVQVAKRDERRSCVTRIEPSRQMVVSIKARRMLRVHELGSFFQS